MNRGEIMEKLNIAKLRGKIAEKKITQSRIAELLNVNRVTISNMINGKAKIDANQLYKLSNILDCPMEYFFTN